MPGMGVPCAPECSLRLHCMLGQRFPLCHVAQSACERRLQRVGDLGALGPGARRDPWIGLLAGFGDGWEGGGLCAVCASMHRRHCSCRIGVALSDVQLFPVLVPHAAGGSVAAAAPPPALGPEMREAITQFVKENEVVAFIKGTKQAPACGFSNTVVGILHATGIPFVTVNILESDVLRAGEIGCGSSYVGRAKDGAKGVVDVSGVAWLHGISAVASVLLDRLQGKGRISACLCGVIASGSATRFPFLSTPARLPLPSCPSAVRHTCGAGMKEYSSWPTFPQVYIGGEFFGGCDILVEAHHSGDLTVRLLALSPTEPEKEQ